MQEFTRSKKDGMIMEVERLKRLREYHQISRDYVASRMNISESRLERLENGESVRDARTLLGFYDLIIKNHVLEHMYEEECFGSGYPIEEYDLMEQLIVTDIRREFLIKDIEKIKTNQYNLD